MKQTLVLPANFGSFSGFPTNHFYVFQISTISTSILNPKEHRHFPENPRNQSFSVADPFLRHVPLTFQIPALALEPSGPETRPRSRHGSQEHCMRSAGNRRPQKESGFHRERMMKQWERRGKMWTHLGWVGDSWTLMILEMDTIEMEDWTYWTSISWKSLRKGHRLFLTDAHIHHYPSTSLVVFFDHRDVGSGCARHKQWSPMHGARASGQVCWEMIR